MQLLIDWGADINLRDKFGKTALMVSAAMSRDNSIRVLLKNGADVNVCTFTSGGGCTALMQAAGRLYGTMEGTEPPVSTVNLLLDAGANPNFQNPKDGVTALMNAASHKHSHLSVQALVDAGADISLTNRQGFDALTLGISAVGSPAGGISTETMMILLNAASEMRKPSNNKKTNDTYARTISKKDEIRKKKFILHLQQCLLEPKKRKFQNVQKWVEFYTRSVDDEVNIPTSLSIAIRENYVSLKAAFNTMDMNQNKKVNNMEFAIFFTRLLGGKK